jgi:hypothetical protein
MKTLRGLVLVALLTSALFVDAARGATALNVDFTDETAASFDGGVLSSPGGTHWNKASRATPAPPNVGWEFLNTPAVMLDEFGAPATGDGLFHLRNPIASSTVTPWIGGLDLPLGTLVGGLQAGPTPTETRLFELVGPFGGSYDLAVYFVADARLRGLPLSTQLAVSPINNFRLTYLFGPPPPEPELHTLSIEGYYYHAAVYRDVVPREMHIGQPGTAPAGWGFSVTDSVAVAGLQLLQVPEPGAGCLLASASLAVVRMRRRTRS